MFNTILKFFDSIIITKKINNFIRKYTDSSKNLVSRKDVIILMDSIEYYSNKHDIYVEIAIFINKLGYLRVQTSKIKTAAFRNKFKNIIYQSIKKYKKSY